MSCLNEDESHTRNINLMTLFLHINLHMILKWVHRYIYRPKEMFNREKEQENLSAWKRMDSLYEHTIKMMPKSNLHKSDFTFKR